MTAAPNWEIEGRDWPNRASSRFVTAAGLRWHVQIMGAGPVALLLHGTGSATHSWRDLAPLLAAGLTLVAPDLPGHGFTTLPPVGRLSLPGMAASIAALLGALEIRPDVIVAHSAGAAIGLRLILDGTIAPRHLVSLSGALMPFPGSAGVVFPALAKLLFLNPLVAPLVTWRAGDASAVARVIAGTGSHLDPAGLDYYHRLLRTRRHVTATMGMMAGWNLWPLLQDLPRLSIPVTLVAPDRDAAVPPRVATRVASLVRHATVIAVPGRGHLAHEEDPAQFAGIIGKACA